MSQPIIIPLLVSVRWREAHAAQSSQRWRSLAQMCSSMAINRARYSPDSPFVDDLRTLAMVADSHANYQACQEERA